MKNEIIYIKAEQNTEVTNKKVFLRDVVKLFGADKTMVDKLNQIVFMVIKSDKDTNYIVSILKIVEMITKEYPGAEVVNIGDTDFVLHYKLPGKPKAVMEYLKVTIVCGVVFFGAAFSIMTFNTDVSVSDVFNKIYILVMGHGETHGSVLEIAYSIGIPIGSLIFYNHFSRLKIQDDPTPIQVEMRNYEEEVNKAMIKNASREGKTIDAD